MSRVEQVSQLLHSQLAELVQREIQLDGVLITIAWVECSPDLRQAKIGVSVLPDKYYGTALTALRQASGRLRQGLSRLNLKFLPRLVWEIDNTEKKAAELEEVFKQAEQNQL